MSAPWHVLGAAAALLAVTGCGLVQPLPKPRQVPAHFGPASELADIRRVMVLPFKTSSGVLADTEAVREPFLSELQKLQRFEIVPLPQDAEAQFAIYNGLQRGGIQPEALTRLGDRYRLDGVILATITGYRPYKPPYLGLRLQMISMHSADAVWATDVFYDSADASTVEDLKHYTLSALAEPDALHGWELLLISPERFATFVAHRTLSRWRGL
ncbi:MAG: hypothetical protein AAF628_02605 [Planctomycetota bacterium]